MIYLQNPVLIFILFHYQNESKLNIHKHVNQSILSQEVRELGLLYNYVFFFFFFFFGVVIS